MGCLFVLALAGIRRLVVQIKEVEKHDLLRRAWWDGQEFFVGSFEHGVKHGFGAL